MNNRIRTPMGHRSDRNASGPLGRNSKMKDLLSDEDMRMNSEEVQAKNNEMPLSFGNFVVRSNQYEYPRMGKVPATRYHSTIVDMKIRTKDGRLILDVYYDFEDVYGQKFHVVQSYPEGSQPFQRLAAALAAAGVPEGSTADAGIGIEEIVELDYTSKTSDLGSIVERQPYVRPSVNEDEETDADDEFDDFLPDDED